ncbi:hypothetical protein L2735_10505 [Shewanella olleyana]|uniref:hypothetical protein n=1 Tax=Shewanella olleyana TaxID=135626 RepID=UPI00200E53B0|nr:hypothetical protein [Shewanella olleyana]MCL1067238.1 hypothetical protein [Shewanella olleyana]
MNKILHTAPNGALPEATSPAYKLLQILAENGKTPRDELCEKLGGGLRSYLQQLTGECYQHWLIRNEKGVFNGRKQSLYWIDRRHFSCDWEQDKDARTIARKRYKDRSYYGCKNAFERLQKAEKEKDEADKEYRKRIESKKPTQS